MDPATQQGAAMAAIGLAGTIAGLFFGWLRDRDKLQFDKKLLALQGQNALQGTQIAALTASSAECEKKHKVCEEQHKTTELRIEEIERQLAQKKVRTVAHNP